MGRFPGRRVLLYVLAQPAGAALGSGLVQLIATPGSSLGATLPTHGTGQALGVETFLTFGLVPMILRVTPGSKESGMLAGLAISATVALEAVVVGPLTGASMNPTRSLAPALLSGNWTDWWVCVMGPVAGALLAVAVDKGLQGRGEAARA